MSKLRDYIALSTDDFEKKHGEESFDETKELARRTNYNYNLVIPIMREQRERLIAEGASEQGADKNIRRILKRKAFSEEFITKYIAALKGVERKGFEDMIKHFEITYYGEPLKASDLEGELNINKLVIPEHLVSFIKQTIKTMDIDEKYQGAIEQILDVSDKPRPMVKIKYSSSDIIDTINPIKSNEREEFYEFWEEIYPKYDELKKAIEEVLRDWQQVSKDIYDKSEENKDLHGQYKETLDLPEVFKESEEFVELEKEMITLAKLFSKMSNNMNYVMETEPLSFKLHSRHDDEIHDNVIEMLKDEILSLPLFDEGSSTTGADTGEDEYESDPDNQSVPAFEGDDSSKIQNPQGQADYDPRDPEAYNAHVRQEIERSANLYQTLHYVDPLTALSQFKNKFKRGAFTSRTYQKFMNEMERQMKELASADPAMIDQLWELLEDLEEAQDELVDASKDAYHVPLTAAMAKILNMSKEETIDNISEIDSFHKELLENIQDIVEIEDDKSMAPWITEFIDTRESVSTKHSKSDATKESVPRTASFQLGKTGMPRALGDYAESITELLRVVNEYYVTPAESHYLPFESIPAHLDSKFLSQIKVIGPDSLYQLLEFGFYSVGAQMIDRHEMAQINAFLSMMKNPTEINMIDAIQTTEDLLEILDNIFDERFKENDKKLLAKVLIGIATKNDIATNDISLDGESIDSLAKGYKRREHTSSYFLLIKLLRHYKTLFLKDTKKKKEMDKFYELLEGTRNPILLSQQRDILIVHDEIRKMTKRPIHYAYKNLNDYDNINDTIDMVKAKYRQDITATEITSIVTDFDSINSISKKHGLGEELVYHIKGLYR